MHKLLVHGKNACSFFFSNKCYKVLYSVVLIVVSNVSLRNQIKYLNQCGIKNQIIEFNTHSYVTNCLRH